MHPGEGGNLIWAVLTVASTAMDAIPDMTATPALLMKVALCIISGRRPEEKLRKKPTEVEGRTARGPSHLMA